MAATVVEGLVSRKWLAEISTEETSTEVQVRVHRTRWSMRRP
jgi:hypothetical protein